MTSRVALLLAVVLATALAAEDTGYIWVEGENPSSGHGYPHPWYSEAVQKAMLSGGAFLSSFTDKADTEVAYDVDVPTAGVWTLWARVNPIAAKVAWKLDAGDWQEIDLSGASDNQNIANDGKPDLRFLAWVQVGKPQLGAGKHSIGFKLHSDNNHHGALDCFVLCAKPFMPSGTRQPGPRKAEAVDPSAYIWIEGEDALSTNLKPHNWYSGMVKKDALSGGEFLSSFDGPPDASAAWDVEAAKAGDYTLWLRMNPVQAKASWRLDGGAWQGVPFDRATDNVNIANDGKPDLRFVAWINCGKTQLKAGKSRFELRLESPLHNHGSVDCILFAARPFNPNGKQKPGTTLSEADPGCFAFDVPMDEFAATALLDLRQLNEKRAGAHGRVAAKGDGFVLGDGSPVRFWAANAGPADNTDADAYLAARLAKCGVNLARIHGGIADRGGSDPTAIDRGRLARVQEQVEAFADQGIYTYLSTYFPLWMQLKDSDGIEGAAIGKNPFALLLFEPRFQSFYKAWSKQMLTTKNPKTGKSLAEEPALAIWEIENEDSFFFWTFKAEALGPGPWARLEGMFFDSLAARYGDIAKARAAWGGERHGDDDDATKRMGLYGAWEMAGGYAQSGPGKQARIRDQIRFLAELQHKTYADLAKYLREECGFKGVITASNWTTADNRQLLAIERWTYTATDAIDRHGYFGGKHEGDGSGWSVRVGNTYTDRAAVLEPTEALVGYAQIAGRPHIHTEVMWNSPNRFVADGPLLLSAYGDLQGVDAWFSFATHDGNWVSQGTNKWPMMSPGWLGQFPAAALQFRRGDVQEAPVVVRQVASADDMFARKGGGFVEGGNADFRIAEAPKAADAGEISAFDPLSYCVGRVERVMPGIAGAPADAKPMVADLAKSIDRGAKVVTSATGQLRWDWGNGVVTVDTPRSQAATGFLAKAGDIHLGDITIHSGNEYGTVWAISLDGQPLASAKRILVQAFTEQHLHGWRATGGHIEDVGAAPWNVRDIDATVTWKNAPAKAQVLDGHGYPVADLALSGNALTLPKDALYVVLSR